MSDRMMKRYIASTALSLGALTLVYAGQLRAAPFEVVQIKGAEFISESDIALACDITPGVEYSADDMRDVEGCLMQSGQFRSVEVRGEGETLVVAVEELETRPGRLELGLAYDSRDSATANLYFERYNLFPGVFGAVDLKYSKQVAALQTSLYAADAFGDVDFGIDTALRRTDYDDQGFSSRRALIEPYLAYQLPSGLRGELGLGYRMDEMKDPQAGASALFAAEAGRVDAPYLRFGLRYSDGVDSGEVGALTGVSVTFDHYFWGLGSDHRSSETRVALNARMAVSEKTSLLLGAQAGMVSAEGGQSTRAVDRFFIGGSDFRGFAPRGIGPKDGDHWVGANRYFVTSIELQHEVDQIFGSSAKVGLFADIGSAWGLDDTLGGAIDDARYMRSTIGLSLTLDLGNVPVSIFVAKPLESRPGDDAQSFGLSFSTTF
ncbi:BamA/TamA family outer membrane protein [Xinfangfangia sp. CPCC 101601]|uniref:BamA/TamA family outer membrane protein n=1 Tax=Pseudogemmobacter lacusdianii TaxID=3069608 RepID=A0ABU0VUE6_9RHOB|nr:BamA/TamA family outer membrane protein [Xinfangfangia sp. CPCC 101601]MDQ2065351.1 BamA/TamA family outer membrane protein [Xinfangfangia sp. CPCC 101601]